MTKTAAAGKFETHGEDCIQFVDDHGNVIHYVDGQGQIYGTDFIADSVSLKALQQQVDSLQISGLPPAIDSGTF